MTVSLPIPDISVIITVYKNKDMLVELHDRLCQALEGAGILFEMIFVDDRCPDGSLSVLEKLADRDGRVIALQLEHNVGQQKAVMAGISVAEGQAVVIMDGDLQDSPEAVPGLFHALQAGYDLVYAGRRGKYEEEVRLLTSRLYKLVMHLLVGIPADAGLFLITKKKLAKNLLSMNVPHPHIPAMLSVQTKDSLSIPVEREKRPSGKSTFTSWMRLRMGILAAIWALGWRLGFRSRHRQTRPGFVIKEKIGRKFYQK